MGTGLRGRFWSAAAALAALGAAGAGGVDAAPLPAFAGTTVITVFGNAGIAMSLPRTSSLDTRGRAPHEYAVTIARRGGTYAFVGLSEPEACRRYNDPGTAICMAVHGYDLSAFQRPGMPDWWGKEVVTLDPPVVGKGRIDVYVLTDGEVTLTVRFKGLKGTRRVRADRKVTGWMRELPRTCPAPCQDVAFGGEAHDVGKAGFVAAIAVGVRDVDSGTTTPLGPLAPGTQTADSCIYPNSESGWSASPEPSQHPTGCDPVGDDPIATASTALNAPTMLDPRTGAAGWRHYDYGARGRVYVGFRGAVANTVGTWHAVAGYGVWVSDGIR